MNKNALSPWVLSQVVLSGLGLFLFHALITKQYRGAPLTLTAWLAAVFILVLVIRRVARNVAPESRSRGQQIWAGLDEIGLAFVAFFFLLLVVFDNQYFHATADGREYFAHVRSLVIDLDLDFANENKLFRTGGVPQHFPFGSAVLWLPFYLVTHLWLGLLNLLGGSFDRDGFNNTYQMAVGLGTLTYGFIGLLMLYRIGRDYFAPRIIAAATMLLTSRLLPGLVSGDRELLHPRQLDVRRHACLTAVVSDARRTIAAPVGLAGTRCRTDGDGALAKRGIPAVPGGSMRQPF